MRIFFCQSALSVKLYQKIVFDRLQADGTNATYKTEWYK